MGDHDVGSVAEQATELDDVKILEPAVVGDSLARSTDPFSGGWLVKSAWVSEAMWVAFGGWWGVKKQARSWSGLVALDRFCGAPDR